jgi:hypothetical protein
MILIGGTQSSGTTLLLALMHRLGANTGYRDGKVNEVMDSSRFGKGLEYKRETRRDSKTKTKPVVIKEACWTNKNGNMRTVMRHYDEEKAPVHLIICTRNFDSTTKSVQNFQIEFGRALDTDSDIEGHLHTLLVSAGRVELESVTLIDFPRYAVDCEYLRKKLEKFESYLPKFDELRTVFKETVKKEKIL